MPLQAFFCQGSNEVENDYTIQNISKLIFSHRKPSHKHTDTLIRI
jgi:hypothetical protein